LNIISNSICLYKFQAYSDKVLGKLVTPSDVANLADVLTDHQSTVTGTDKGGSENFKLAVRDSPDPLWLELHSELLTSRAWDDVWVKSKQNPTPPFNALKVERLRDGDLCHVVRKTVTSGLDRQ
jgi:hypothetical protein